MDLAVEGRHALLFDDDATAAFVNAPDALVPWSGDPALLIDRYDVRHLLDRIPPRPPVRAASRLCELPAVDGVTSSQLDHERYLDLPLSGPDADPGGDDDHDGARGSLSAQVEENLEEQKDKMLASGSGALSLLGSFYGTVEDDDGSDTKVVGSVHTSIADIAAVPHKMIDKIVEFILRNGKEFEAVLIEQDKTVGRFPFLLPSNQYHPYYLKVLEGARQSGDPLSKLTGSITAQNSSLEISAAGSSRSGAGSDLLVKEREGSSVPFDAEISGRSTFQERESDHDVSEEYRHREKHESCSRDLKTDDMAESHKQSKKRHRSEHSINHRSGDKRHRKHHSSSKDKESRHRHKHHSSSEDEYGHRKHSRSHHRHKDEGTPEEKERTGSDGHRRKHHRRSQRNHHIDEEVNTTILVSYGRSLSARQSRGKLLCLRCWIAGSA
ncbi:hypothetical protein BHM03_00005239 [Ensete ventricosum]|nr:hypothetical protein BHM03_00005239 [Ensete ventricosum]